MKMNHGIRINNPDGSLLFECGAHLISRRPEIARKLGEIAAYWAQAEGILAFLYGKILDMDPNDARQTLRRMGAYRLKEEVESHAPHNLSGADLSSVLTLTARFDGARVIRNRTQHDVWGIKGSDANGVYAVLSEDYMHFALHATQLSGATRVSPSAIIAFSEQFAALQVNRHDEESLERLRSEIEGLCHEIFAVGLKLGRGFQLLP